jgi:hypothetical protein
LRKLRNIGMLQALLLSLKVAQSLKSRVEVLPARLILKLRKCKLCKRKCKRCKLK